MEVRGDGLHRWYQIQISDGKRFIVIINSDMTSKLTEITQQRNSAEIEMLSRQSMRWLQTKMNLVRNPMSVARGINSEKDRYRNMYNLGYNGKFLLGGMYFFFYNPKTKNDLPYYDIFPLVMPLEKHPDGFLGINLHYLPPQMRFMLLNKLISRAVYDSNDELKRLKVSYDVLSATRRYREFRPCVKKYLFTHIKSKILAVGSDEWDVATYLPVQQFKKAPTKEVWQDSINEIRNS